MRKGAILTKEETIPNVMGGVEERTISSLEIAEMMEMEHWKLLRKLDGSKNSRGVINILNDNKIVADDYFVPSSYTDAKGERRPCYQVTKLGCDFLANKFTGEKGVLFTARYVKRFDEMERHIKNEIAGNSDVMTCLQSAKFIADDLRLAESSRLFMYGNLLQEFGLPSGFLPHYEDNGSRERATATALLQRNGFGISAVEFNKLLLKHGYLEERERNSSKGKKKYKALTEKGLRYGVNLISDKNQKETQPYYYADSFAELYRNVT